MTDVSLSRRRALQCSVTGSVVAIAGCLGGDDDDDETASPSGNETGNQGSESTFSLAGNGSEGFRDWLAPEAAHSGDGETEVLFAVQDFDVAIDQGSEELSTIRESEAASYGVEPRSLKQELIVGTPGDSGRLGSIYLGEFDTEQALSELESQGLTASEEYEGYSVFEGQLAIGEDAIVLTPEYQQFIDTKLGSGPSIETEYGDLSTLLDLQPEAGQISVSKRNGIEDVSLTGSAYVSFEPDGNFTQVIRTFIFDSADDASIERAEEITAQGRYQETLNSEQQGRVVMMEYNA